VDHGRGQTLSSREEFLGWLNAFTAISSDIKIVHARYRIRLMSARFGALIRTARPLKGSTIPTGWGC
jgi:hypothetical protein